MARSGRLLELAYLLSGRRPHTVHEIADRFDISVRTAYRDLSELEASRLPVESTQTGFRIPETARLLPITLSTRERTLLQLALANPAFRKHAGLRQAFASISAKLAALARSSRDASSGAIELANIDRSGEIAAAVLENLELAIERSRVCEVVYESLSDGRARKRKLDPHRVFQRAEAWYVAGCCHDHEIGRGVA